MTCYAPISGSFPHFGMPYSCILSCVYLASCLSSSCKMGWSCTWFCCAFPEFFSWRFHYNYLASPTVGWLGTSLWVSAVQYMKYTYCIELLLRPWHPPAVEMLAECYLIVWHVSKAVGTVCLRFLSCMQNGCTCRNHWRPTAYHVLGQQCEWHSVFSTSITNQEILDRSRGNLHHCHLLFGHSYQYFWRQVD